MRQTSLFNFSKNAGLSPNTPIVDLFCGCGGYSCGAERAGHNVVLAVDSDHNLLDMHALNHTNCEHICCELPRDDLPFPTSGPWHLHASPPCTKLSNMQPLQYEREREQAIELVQWFFDLVRQKNPSSWSFEQVNHELIRSILTKLKATHPTRFDWMVVDAVNYEVPQNRKRIVAGTPFVMANLRLFKSRKRKLTVIDVIPDPPRAFIRNNLYTRPDPVTRERYDVDLKDQIRPVTVPSFTILATGHKRWSDEEGNVLRHLSVQECALIQTFPLEYKMAESRMVSRVGIGNAVPCRLAEILMKPTTWLGRSTQVRVSHDRTE
jgi:site-specific DNA-cytosine methylase